jgi:hypothetical protein
MDQLNKIVKFIIYKNGKNSTPVTKNHEEENYETDWDV